MASEEQTYHATRFKLEIELGNDTMQTRSDVARALEQVIATLRETEITGGVVHDTNGNSTGSWRLGDRWEDLL